MQILNKSMQINLYPANQREPKLNIGDPSDTTEDGLIFNINLNNSSNLIFKKLKYTTRDENQNLITYTRPPEGPLPDGTICQSRISEDPFETCDAHAPDNHRTTCINPSQIVLSIQGFIMYFIEQDKRGLFQKG